MARPKAKAPTLRHHLSGQSVVTIDGRDFYLGKHDSPESLARYAVLIGIYQSSGLTIPERLSVDDLDAKAGLMLSPLAVVPQQQEKEPILVRHVTAAFRERVKVKYASQHSEKARCIQVCDELDKHDGNKLAMSYGPLSLLRQVQRWVDDGKARVYCNRLMRVVQRCFQYAVSQELVDEGTWRRLTSIESLREGQTSAPETEPVKPANLEHVRATCKLLSPVLKAMIRVHVATGMRPSELCRMRPMDIDRTAEVWIYRPPKHKNRSKGKARAIPLIGDAREAITDYLNRKPDTYCFSPIEAVAWRHATERANRKTKVQPSQVDRSIENPQVEPGECYDQDSYRRAICRAAKRAGVPHWFPYQLRHLAGTVVRDVLGVEAAQAMLGHSRIDMTEHYAKLNEYKAIEAAKAAPQLGGLE
jgi:integrase